MATNESTAPVAQITDLTARRRKRSVDSPQSGEQSSVSVTKLWAHRPRRVSMPDLSKIPDLPGFSKLAALTTFPLDVAAAVLDAQSAFVMELAESLVPAKTVRR